MRGVLLRLVLVVLLPLLVVQAGIYVAWYYTRWTEEAQANLEVAWAVATTFQARTDDVHRQESMIGAALVGLNPYTTAQANEFLKVNRREYSSILAWNWIDADGKVIASSDSRAIDLNVADRTYFQKVRAGKSWAISDILVERASGAPTFVIARRIADTQGVLRGVVSATIEVGGFGAPLIAEHRGEKGAVAIFDRAGVLVYDSADPSAAHRSWREDDNLLDAALDSHAEESGVITLPSGGQRYIAARVPIQDTGWVAGARRPVRLAMANVYTGLWIAIGLNLLVALGSGAFAAWTGGRLIHQLRRLQLHAQAIERGDFRHTVERDGVRELSDLAAAFNQMGAAVHAVQQVQERSLQEQSSVLDAFFQHTFTCLVILDRDFDFIRVNEAYAKACQRQVADFPGHNHFEFYPHEGNEAIFRQVVRHRTPYQTIAKPFEFPDHPEWGVTYWDWSLVPIVGDSGEVDFLVFSLNDVTAQKRIEEELRAASLYARGLLEASLDPLVTISPEGKVTDVNEATAVVTGVPREQLIGSDFSEYFTEPARARDGYRAVLSEGLVRDYPLTIRHVSGRTIDVLYNAVVYRNAAGEVQGVFAAARDITERKRAEAELEKHHHHLEELVQQRTGELETANAQLRAVFDVVNVGMLLIDEHGVVQRVNNTISRWLGRDVLASGGNQPGDILGCVHALGDSGGCGLTDHCPACPIRNAFQSVLRSGQPVHDVETDSTFAVDGKQLHLWLEVQRRSRVLGWPSACDSGDEQRDRPQAGGRGDGTAGYFSAAESEPDHRGRSGGAGSLRQSGRRAVVPRSVRARACSSLAGRLAVGGLSPARGRRTNQRARSHGRRPVV